MVPSCQIDFGVYFLLALAVLVLPPDWLAGAVLAAFFHELCHYLTLKALRVSCLGIHCSAGGIVMETSPVNPKEEVLASLAGPMGSFLLLVFIQVFPQLSVCGLVQGCFNLLPIYPLDGGRIVRCLLGKSAKWVEWGSALAVLCVGIWLTWKYHLGIFPVIACIAAAGKGLLRKIPCKADKLGVQ